MTNADIRRELTKVQHALTYTERHLTLTNEANAALHMNDKVFYSPLTGAVHEASESIARILAALSEQQEVTEMNHDDVLRLTGGREPLGYSELASFLHSVIVSREWWSAADENLYLISTGRGHELPALRRGQEEEAT